jgi:polyferredoxin
MAVGMAHRPTLRLNVLRDRAVMARPVEDGALENVYRLRLSNAQERSRTLHLSVESAEDVKGIDGLSLVSSGWVELPPNSDATVNATVRLSPQLTRTDAGRVLPIRFRVQAESATDREEVVSTSTFLVSQ